MSIIKSKQASNYTVLPNEIFKSGLRLDSIGVLAYLLSLPPDWVIYKSTLYKTFGIGKEKMQAIFKDLGKAGYMLSVMRHREDGKIEYEHVVYDKPYNGEPDTGQPLPEKPYTANQPLLSTNIQSTKEQKKKRVKKEHSLSPDIMARIPNEILAGVMSWLEYKASRKQYYTERGFELWLKKFSHLTEKEFEFLYEYSVIGNYPTLYLDQLKNMPKESKKEYKSQFGHETW